MGDRAFAVAERRAWTSLPDAIRRSPSLADFRRSLKTHFYIHTHTRLTALFRDYPGEPPVPER